MEPSQELMSTLTSLDKLINYVQTHELHTILIAVGVLLAPFVLRAVLWGIWRLFACLGQLFFKDQIKDFVRNRICAVLQHYVDESIVIDDMPLYQTNMITLYRLHWSHGNYRANINRAEVMVDLGSTVRQYMKLWLKHWFCNFDYPAAQKTLLCNCIKDVRFYRAEVEITIPKQGGTTDVKLLPSGKEVLKKSFLGLEELRKFNICIAFESSEILLHVAEEDFRFQNFFGMVENSSVENGSKCSMRFGCIYDGENISFNSLDNNLERFMLVISDLYFSDKIWRTLCTYCNFMPQGLEIKDGKLLDIRAFLAMDNGKLVMEQINAKMDETQFTFGECHVDDLEISLVSYRLEVFDIKKAVARVNDVGVSFKGVIQVQGNVLTAEKSEIHYDERTAVFYGIWYNLQTGEYGYDHVDNRMVDAIVTVQKIRDALKEKVKEKLSGLKEKIKFLTKD